MNGKSIIGANLSEIFHYKYLNLLDFFEESKCKNSND